MKRLTVCVPSGWLVKADPLFRIFNFVNGRAYFYMAISNRVDLNRSICVKVALDRNESLLMIDSDVVPTQSFDEVYKILREDEKEADMILGVIASRLGILVNNFVKDSDKFYVDYGSLGFIYIPLRTLKKLPILSWYKIRDDAQFPMYFQYTQTLSDDGDFLLRMKMKGMKIMADKRIKLVHVKDCEVTVQGDGKINTTL